ncbi:glycoside hydrolase [Rhodococcus pyridinivorans]|uniref:F510_1955 family glycosylhydrolase n=1 Tax=Rhodococcus TaxID=1827 RepID=UPI001E5493A9|nr:sialidase family protein [Rhodococcus pyridinivorans]UGQ56241.1 glycoside hydrolase [Rhodococcus pyridinivorans]
MSSFLLRRWARVLVPVAAVVVLAGCATGEQSTTPADADSPTPASEVPGTALEPALDHLHGLHLDADGVILAGTHTGLVEIADSGRTSLVGVSDDDFMGLTGEPGTDRLFASGHPGPSSSAPNPLGLIDSADGGRTWIPKSLTGEVDFHALATDGELLVGFDGVTGLLVSTDGGSSWTPGAPVAAAALAVTDGGVWATTTAGLQHSTDAGLTFTVVPDAPRLALLSAAQDGSLWGIDTTGTAWRSRTGQAWESRAVVGPVEAVLAVDFDTAYAATAEMLYPLN